MYPQQYISKLLENIWRCVLVFCSHVAQNCLLICPPKVHKCLSETEKKKLSVCSSNQTAKWNKIGNYLSVWMSINHNAASCNKWRWLSYDVYCIVQVDHIICHWSLTEFWNRPEQLIKIHHLNMIYKERKCIFMNSQWNSAFSVLQLIIYYLFCIAYISALPFISLNIQLIFEWMDLQSSLVAPVLKTSVNVAYCCTCLWLSLWLWTLMQVACCLFSSVCSHGVPLEVLWAVVCGSSHTGMDSCGWILWEGPSGCRHVTAHVSQNIFKCSHHVAFCSAMWDY